MAPVPSPSTPWARRPSSISGMLPYVPPRRRGGAAAAWLPPSGSKAARYGEIQVERAQREDANTPRMRWPKTCRPSPRAARMRDRLGGASTLLSPFDSFLWHRERSAPPLRLSLHDGGPCHRQVHKRVHGYYTLPIFHNSRAHRPRRRRRSTAPSVASRIKWVRFERWVAPRGTPARRGLGALSIATPPSGGARRFAPAPWPRSSGAEHDLPRPRRRPSSLRAPLARALRTLRPS